MSSSFVEAKKMSSEIYWKKLVVHKGDSLGKKALHDLINGKYSVIVLKDYLSSSDLLEIKEKIATLRARIEVKEYSNGALTTFGSYLAKHLNSLENYFNKAKETDLLFDPDNDLRVKVREYLCQVFSLSSLNVAAEQTAEYSPAVVRLHANGVSNPLHNDLIMRDADHTNLVLRKLINQLSCIVCLQECDRGGELKNYYKRWDQIDEIYKIPGNGLGYDSKVIENTPCSVFKPSEGDIYIIDPTYYHEICKVFGKTRITLGFFFGFFDLSFEHGVAWS